MCVCLGFFGLGTWSKVLFHDYIRMCHKLHNHNNVFSARVLKSLRGGCRVILFFWGLHQIQGCGANVSVKRILIGTIGTDLDPCQFKNWEKLWGNYVGRW
jgi:hypothetical protein